jgi:glucose/arabinose dehydrogenase
MVFGGKARAAITIVIFILLTACNTDPTADPAGTTSPTATSTLASTETPSPTNTSAPAPTGTPIATPSPMPTPTGTSTPMPSRRIAVEVVAEDLVAPWALAFASDGRLFVTERGGSIRAIENGQARLYLEVDGVEERGESGLLGLALDPDFETTRHLFIYHSYDNGDDGLLNRVVRLRDTGETAVEPTVILDDIPGAGIHNGGRIKFGPDSLLYIAAGDAAFAEQAQDVDSLGGKILRIRKDGSIPQDNPFAGSPVYSYGHRNPQGLAFHPVTGQLFATEHGQSATDEVNMILPGRNYGWPIVRGDEHEAPYQTPVLQSGSTTWAPSGAAFYPVEGGVLPPEWSGLLVYAGLVGQRLKWIELAAPGYDTVRSHGDLFVRDYGRLREVVVGPDGYIYFTINNRDGRGSPESGDDKILRIVPAP